MLGNDAPATEADSYLVVQTGELIDENVGDNDADEDVLFCTSTPVSVSDPEKVEHLEIGFNCDFSFDPVNSAFGPVTVEYEVCDAHTLANPAHPDSPYGADGREPGRPRPPLLDRDDHASTSSRCWSSIPRTSPSTRRPTCAADEAQTPFGTDVDIDVLANDADLDVDEQDAPVTCPARSPTTPAPATEGGSFVLNGDGTELVYTPADGFSGVDTFDYVAQDEIGQGCAATVTVTVAADATDPTDPTTPPIRPTPRPTTRRSATRPDPDDPTVPGRPRPPPAPGSTTSTVPGSTTTVPGDGDGPAGNGRRRRHGHHRGHRLAPGDRHQRPGPRRARHRPGRRRCPRLAVPPAPQRDLTTALPALPSRPRPAPIRGGPPPFRRAPSPRLRRSASPRGVIVPTPSAPPAPDRTARSTTRPDPGGTPRWRRTPTTRPPLEKVARLRREAAETTARLQAEIHQAEQEVALEAAATSFERVNAAVQTGQIGEVEDWVAVLGLAPDEAIRAAGFLIKGTGGRSSSSGMRAPRLSIEDVTAKLPSGPFTVAALADAIDREVPTARNYVPKLLEAGIIVESGVDESAARPAASPKLYRRLLSPGQPQRSAHVGVDAEAELADELVREQGVAGVEASHAHVTEDLLQPVALERPGAAAEVHGACRRSRSAWSITNDRVATRRTGQSSCSTPLAQSVAVRSS